jgi:hypothetical protein
MMSITLEQSLLQRSKKRSDYPEVCMLCTPPSALQVGEIQEIYIYDWLSRNVQKMVFYTFSVGYIFEFCLLRAF